MLRCSVKLSLAACVVLLVLPATARAQDSPWEEAAMMAGTPAKETVAGVGAVVLRRQPTAMRMLLNLPGKGKNLEEALAKLKQRREAALAELEKLKVDKDSITLGNPTAATSMSDAQRRRQFEQMVRQRMRASGAKGGKVPKLPEVVSVGMMLTAQWPLEAKDPERLLVTTHGLQQQLKEADLAGAKDKAKDALTPEEQEMVEEGDASGDNPFGNSPDGQEVEPGAPMFVYVAKITEEERNRALADAFAKAKAQAAQLALAAGARLGPLVGLSGQGGGSSEVENPYEGGMPSSYRYVLARQRNAAGQDQKENESVASDSGSITFRFHVRAIFALEKPAALKASPPAKPAEPAAKE
jgi:uncharacterized protein YggE